MGRSKEKTSSSQPSLKDFCQYIPLRLSPEERSLLTVLEHALQVSEYTDHVDVSRQRNTKARRILDGILEACHISTGLLVASAQEQVCSKVVQESCLTGSSSSSVVVQEATTTKKKKKKKKHKPKLKQKKRHGGPTSNTPPLPVGTSSWASRTPDDNAALFQTMFEIGRRNKVLNPSSMRTTYGKLMYLLQDAQNPTVAKSLGFSLYKDLVLVSSYLEQHGGLGLLDDDRLEGATQHICTVDPVTGDRLDRDDIAQRVSRKRQLQEELVEEYSTSTLSTENCRRVIDSIADAIAYVESNVAPVQCMLTCLETNFVPHTVRDGFSLQLTGVKHTTKSGGGSRYGLSAFHNSSGGATLSHSHSMQYTFVWQSLRLWCKVQRHMHQLWVSADDDLLSTSTTYHLQNTGQGLNRVQSCPRVAKVMRSLLQQTQQEAGSPWVGLSVVHLGDRDVPNALVFIDKYTQIPRFLHPICEFLQGIPALCRDERIAAYVKAQFGSEERLKMTVLADYFKHGFDGSGDDGGSCIDGRLTSSWNWTSRLAKKSYYHAFMLSGFQGFDGDFK